MLDFTERNLPEEFDEVFGIRYFWQIMDILQNRSDFFFGFTFNDIQQILDMMKFYHIPIPSKYLNRKFPKEVWIDNNGGYLTYEPEEKHRYQHMVMEV